jgi:hypothetical protein
MEMITVPVVRETERRSVAVPAKTDEREMVQLLASKFGEEVKKRWRVIVRNFASCEQPFRTVNWWSYELAEPEEPAEPPAPMKVMANRRRWCLRWDIELDTSLTERQVHKKLR